MHWLMAVNGLGKDTRQEKSSAIRQFERKSRANVLLPGEETSLAGYL